MDCPDTCALEVAVEDGRIAGIIGATDHPTTAGFICGKIARFDKRVYHDDRLLYPMRLRGAKGSGAFERISWDEAIAAITARFREIIARWGSEAILPYHYGGSNGFLSDGLLDEFYFAKLGASRLGRTLCAATATEVAVGMYGKMPGVAFEDFGHAKLIVIWGANPKASNIHLVPFLRQAKRNGAFVAILDPLKNFSPAEADLHLPVFPGADLPVALAMIRVWKERGQLDHRFLQQHADGLETVLVRAEEWPLERAAAAARVPAGDILRLAEAYAEASPALIRVGWGIERNRNGGQAIAALLAMPALLGKFGARGGGYTLSNSGAARLDKHKIFGEYSWNTREINMTRLGEALGDSSAPPVQGLFVYNCNPAVTVPDQESVLRGLERENLFTVVCDQVMTDTAPFADILLPATTFLEHHDIRRSYGSYVVGGSAPVIAARGEARPNEMIFAALGRAMGWEDAPFAWDSATCMRKVTEALTLAGRPADPAALAAGKCQGYDFPGPQPIQFQTVFPMTPDGKIHLTPQTLGPRPFAFDPVESEQYPLALVSPSSSRMITSTLGEDNYPELRVSLHRSDAAARGISDGDVVRVFNEWGEVVCRARWSDRLRDGVVSIPKGAWRKSSLNGRTSTALCPATTNIVGGGACYNDARVEIERA